MTITIDGARHRVPKGITVIQAMWTLGKPQLHGIGCLGGACGACPISTIFPNQFQPKCSLACQTLVSEGMSITFLPSDSSIKEVAPLPSDLSGGRHLLRYYIETRRCVTCGACSSVCPQGIDAMGGMRAAINGHISALAEKFAACVSCGLCASVCNSRIRPHRVGLYARRLCGAFYEKEASDLLARIESIGSGQYDAEWKETFRFIEEEHQEEVAHECV